MLCHCCLAIGFFKPTNQQTLHLKWPCMHLCLLRLSAGFATPTNSFPFMWPRKNRIWVGRQNCRIFFSASLSFLCFCKFCLNPGCDSCYLFLLMELQCNIITHWQVRVSHYFIWQPLHNASGLIQASIIGAGYPKDTKYSVAISDRFPPLPLSRTLLPPGY